MAQLSPNLLYSAPPPPHTAVYDTLPTIVSYASNVRYCLLNGAPEVMDGNLGMLADNFVLVVHISGGEVDENIDDEHDVNCNQVAI